MAPLHHSNNLFATLFIFFHPPDVRSPIWSCLRLALSSIFPRFSPLFRPLRMRLLVGRSPAKTARITSSRERLGQGEVTSLAVSHRYRTPKAREFANLAKICLGSVLLSVRRNSWTRRASCGVRSSWNLLYESVDWTIFQWPGWPRCALEMPFFRGETRNTGFSNLLEIFGAGRFFLLDTVTSYFGNNIRKVIRKFIATKY